MIKAYKVKYLSAHTDIKSYTIFGAFCWGYKLLNGEKALDEFLSDFIKNPKFLVSSPFPLVEDNLLFPKPALNIEFEDIPLINKLKRKPYKKAKYITQEVLKDIISGKVKTQNQLMKNYKANEGIIFKNGEEINKPTIKEQIFAHNIINRLDSTSENLYFEKGLISDTDYFLVKFLDESFVREFETVLKVIEDIGLGGNKNIGWGKVEISAYNKDISFLDMDKTRKFISLSSVIPSENILSKESAYTLFTYKAFTEGSFYQGLPKKKTFYLDEGSVITTKDKNKFAGQIKNVSIDEKTKIYQYGLEFPIYLRWGHENNN